jgi:hypothetical protein
MDYLNAEKVIKRARALKKKQDDERLEYYIVLSFILLYPTAILSCIAYLLWRL